VFKSYRRTQAEVEELNLIPIMNLFIVLIPFLLAAAAFYQVGIIPVSTPQSTPNQTDVPKTPVTVTLNMVVGLDVIKVTVSSTSLSDEEKAALAFDIPAKGKSWDLPQLQQRLKELKNDYPKSNTVMMLPKPKVDYSRLVALLDAIRERKVADEQFEALFPVTVFSQFVPPPLEGEGEEGGEGGEGAEGGGEVLDLEED